MSRFELMGRPVEVKVWSIIKRLTTETFVKMVRGGTVQNFLEHYQIALTKGPISKILVIIAEDAHLL